MTRQERSCFAQSAMAPSTAACSFAAPSARPAFPPAPTAKYPNDVYRRLTGVPPGRTAAEGVTLAAETVQQLAAIPGVAGVHLLVAGNEQAVPAILDQAGLTAARGSGGC